MVEVVGMNAKDVLGREGEWDTFVVSEAKTRSGTQRAGLGEHALWLGVAA
jgi:hypothetical protein